MDTIDIVGPFSENQIGVEATVGYLRSDNQTTYEWLCHETVTQPEALITPRYVENGDGMMLTIIGDRSQARETEESLYWSEDGCDWFTPNGLTGHQVTAAVFDPSDSQRALAITANPGETNHLFSSVDAGRTWTMTGLSIEEGQFSSIRFGGVSTGSTWISAVRHETHDAWVYHSSDSGRTWAEHAFEVTTSGDLDIFVDVVIADKSDPLRAWVVMGPFLDDRLLETRDGGQTFTTVYTPEGDIIDGAQDRNGSLWLITTGNKVIFSESGEFYQRIHSAPLSLGVETSGTDVYFSTRIPSEGYGMATYADDTFTPVYVLRDTRGPPQCEEESQSAEICEPLWPDLSAMISGTSDTASPTDSDETEEADEIDEIDEIDSPSTSSDSPDDKKAGCTVSPARQGKNGPWWTLMLLVVAACSKRKKRPVETTERF